MHNEQPRLSSYNDDLDVSHPAITGRQGEYTDYPLRGHPEEGMVVTRLAQFGVTPELVQQRFGKPMHELTWEEHNHLLAEVIQIQYDTVVATVFDPNIYIRPDQMPDWETRWQQMLHIIKQFEAKAAHPGVRVIKRGDAFADQGNLVMAIEGGAHLIRNTRDVDHLIQAGVRIIGLQYNTDNPLADSYGLTTLGREISKYLLDHDIVIDLAHAVQAVRSDVFTLARDAGRLSLLSYTHGALQEDLVGDWTRKAPDRGLQPTEALTIMQGGGLIGIGVSFPFFAATQAVAERIDDLLQASGQLQSIAIGADFGGVPPSWLLPGLQTPAQVAMTLGDQLAGRFGLSDENVDALLRKNIPHYLQRVQP